MKIITNYYTPSYKSTRIKQFDKAGRVINCHYTNFNRADTNWSKLARFLDERFREQDRVKINLFGCSDNSDGYTLAMNLIRELGINAKKFFPIEASNLSENIINENKNGRILLHSRDLEYTNSLKMGGFYERDLNSPSQIMQGIEFYPHIVNPKLRNLIHFSTSDLRKASKEQDFSNQVVSFRNGWAFNTLEEQDEISKNLYKNSNSKTLIIIGQSDLFKSDASDALQRNGFKGIKSEVFAGGETDYPSDLIGTPKAPAEYKKFILFEKRGIYV